MRRIPIMTKKLVTLLAVALVLALALSPAAFAKKPDPMPGPSVVQNFDGDVYLFVETPAAVTAPWGKISFDLWGETFKFYFKAANLTPEVVYTLKVGGLELGSFTADISGNGSLSGAVASDSFTNQDVTLTGGSETLTSFYPISFKFIAPTL
jgi:hypothetical protein